VDYCPHYNAATPQQPFATVANYLSRRRVSVASTPLPTTKAPSVFLVSDGAMEKMFAGGQSTYAQTLVKAKAGVNVSQDLNKATTVALRFKISATTSANVVGVLEGSDAKLKKKLWSIPLTTTRTELTGAVRYFPGLQTMRSALRLSQPSLKHSESLSLDLVEQASFSQ
jgi:hypothetical protein